MATLLETLLASENVLLDEFYVPARSPDAQFRTVVSEEIVEGMSYVNLGQEGVAKGKFDQITIERDQLLRIAAKLHSH